MGHCHLCHQKMYYLIDCNQFFVSCEQVFAPNLRKRAVVVLSSNDGCVVARSKQAKALGIPMGAPAYQWQEIFDQHKVAVFSSNFALYADMSQRVMSVLEMFSDDLEIYSIDEGFLWSEEKDPLLFAQTIRATIEKWTGIPVSIGIAKTKTLAKLASDLAKNDPSGVHCLDESTIAATLQKTPVEDVWGVGKRLKEQLQGLRIFTAWDLAKAEKAWIRKQFSVVLQRTALELQGISCLQLEDNAEKQHSILRSRSFGKPVTTLEELKEALAMHTAKASSKLRNQKGLCRVVSVFLMTSRFLKEPYAATLSLTLSSSTAYTPHLIAKAHELLEKLYRPGLIYKKVGVLLSDLSHKEEVQGDFWDTPLLDKKKQDLAMKVVDQIQRTHGPKGLRFAAEGTSQPWAVRNEKRSPHYTTSWGELLEI